MRKSRLIYEKKPFFLLCVVLKTKRPALVVGAGRCDELRQII